MTTHTTTAASITTTEGSAMKAKKIALNVAAELAKIRPDRGNKYASRTIKVKGAGAFEQWRYTCRTMAYLLCISWRLCSEDEFYQALGCTISTLCD